MFIYVYIYSYICFYLSIYNIFPTNDSIIDLDNSCRNGYLKNIYKFISERCKLKANFVSRDLALSSTNNGLYDWIFPAGILYVDCHSSNAFYLITCNEFYMQYVGDTVHTLNEKFNSHRIGFKNPGKYGFCKILSRHFHEDKCKGASCQVQILEKAEGNGRTFRSGLDLSCTSLMKQLENC